MEVVLFAPFSRWTPHLETDLEIAEGHLRAGDQVTWIGCDRDLDICEPNREHAAHECTLCIGKRHAGLRLLSGDVRFVSLSDLATAEDRSRAAGLPTRFADTDELRALELETFDLGYAVLSSLVWCDRDAEVDLGHESPCLGQFLRSAARTYLGLRRFLRTERPDRLYLFNGRMSAQRAALRAAQAEGVEAWAHERGSQLDKYSFSVNAMPHEIGPMTARINASWESPVPDHDEKVRIARNWFEQRAKGIIGCWSSYTDKQKEGALPEDWDPARRNVALYPSSEYEFAAIGKAWQSPLFDVPTEGIVRIAEAVAQAGEVHLTIRMHPSPDAAHSSSADRLRAIDLPHVTIVPPESTVCSYALMNASEKVVVTSSTMGIEATYWRKPSIQAGRSMYSEMGSTHQPQTFGALMDMIHDPDLGPAELEGALRFGYELATFGIPFRYFEPEHLFAGRFKGVKVKPRGRYRVALKLREMGTRASSRVRRLLGAR